MADKNVRYGQVRLELKQELGRTPTKEELAARLAALDEQDQAQERAAQAAIEAADRARAAREQRKRDQKAAEEAEKQARADHFRQSPAGLDPVGSVDRMKPEDPGNLALVMFREARRRQTFRFARPEWRALLDSGALARELKRLGHEPEAFNPWSGADDELIEEVGTYRDGLTLGADKAVGKTKTPGSYGLTRSYEQLNQESRDCYYKEARRLDLTNEDLTRLAVEHRLKPSDLIVGG